jgi:hypothetical protein
MKATFTIKSVTNGTASEIELTVVTKKRNINQAAFIAHNLSAKLEKLQGLKYFKLIKKSESLNCSIVIDDNEVLNTSEMSTKLGIALKTGKSDMSTFKQRLFDMIQGAAILADTSDISTLVQTPVEVN